MRATAARRRSWPMPRTRSSPARRGDSPATSWSTRPCCAQRAKPISASTRSSPGSLCCPTCSWIEDDAMKYLHTMVRVRDLDASLRFYCEGLGLRETRRMENAQGRYTLVFVAADETPEAEIELTWNWPGENGEAED